MQGQLYRDILYAHSHHHYRSSGSFPYSKFNVDRYILIYKKGMIYLFAPESLSPDCHAEHSEASLYRFFADAQNDR